MSRTIEASPAPDPVASSAAPGAGSRFRPDIEALRAIAVVAVLAFHAGVPGFDGGFVGVDVFFVISGFLITGQMLRDASGSGLRFRDFYARRARRLLPAATLVIVATLVGSALVASPLQQASIGADARAATLFYSNMRFAAESTDYFALGRFPSPFQHFWSLSLEEQFYLVWPAVVLLALVGAAGARTHRRRLAIVLTGIVAVSFVACVWLTATNQPWAFFWLGPRAWELALGALVAVGAARVAAVDPRARFVAGCVGLAAIAGSVVLISEESTWPGALAAVPVAGTAAVIVAGTGSVAGPLHRLLRLWPFQVVGRYSYSLYLWHWPALILAGAVFPTVLTNWTKGTAVVLASVVPAVISFHLVENPVRRAPAFRPSRAALAMGAVLIAGSLACSALYGAVTTSGPLDAGRPAAVVGEAIGSGLPITEYVPSGMTPSLEELVAGARPPARPGCSAVNDGEATLDCVLGDGDATPSVVLFGDSHAAHWVPAFEAYAERKGIRVRRLAAGACGSLLYRPTGNSTRNCEAWREQAFELIAREQPELVVLSNQAYKGFARDAAEWEDGMRRTIERLSPTTRVVILGETPWADENVPDCLGQHLEDTAACEPRASLRTLAEIHAVERRVTEELGAGWIDASAWMCADGRCPTVVGNILVYTDPDHLSGPFVQSRVDLLEAALDAELAKPRR